ncbi:MAG: helix-turn-helix domain-containing protein, partial [Acidobacteriota bacterium]
MESVGNGGGVVVARAGEIIVGRAADLPGWALDARTRYLVIRDVPTPAVLRLPSILGLHKPDRRLHLTDDARGVRRLLVAQSRPHPHEGIVDAYAVGSLLTLLLGDLATRTLVLDEVAALGKVEDPTDFTIDADGSFLEWPGQDVHLDAPGILDQIDPDHRARRALEALRQDATGVAIVSLREQRGLRQADIPGLSERHVRRIETGESRLTLEAASALARAMRLDVSDFLDELARRAGAA